jgi:superoxide dismutase, Fe-Mn family
MTEPFSLPPLPYAYDALEPWCPAETLELHHDKHHAAYVTGANEAAEVMGDIDPQDTHRLAGAEAAMAFHMGGNVLHSLFWNCLSPTKTTPGEVLLGQINNDFGGIARLQSLFLATCKGVQGSGWGALTFSPVDGRLHVSHIHDHQQQIVAGSTVLAVIDVWEHAYYLKYRNERASWVGAAFEHLNWAFIEEGLATALPTSSAQASSGAL